MKISDTERSINKKYVKKKNLENSRFFYEWNIDFSLESEKSFLESQRFHV